MLKRLETEIILNEEDQEKMTWAEWAWDSHYWIEEYPGYFHCKLCNGRHTNVTGIGFETVKLCPENPIFKREVEQILKNS